MKHILQAQHRNSYELSSWCKESNTKYAVRDKCSYYNPLLGTTTPSRAAGKSTVPGKTRQVINLGVSFCLQPGKVLLIFPYNLLSHYSTSVVDIYSSSSSSVFFLGGGDGAGRLSIKAMVSLKQQKMRGRYNSRSNTWMFIEDNSAITRASS